MISQTLNLAPADKKIYSLRDSISCVESIPLIASSIMSKKIASGAQKIVLDVTCGSGAFMHSQERAEELAKEMIEIGRLADKETVCVLTNMDEPLGYAVGNTLEVIEAIECLKGNMPEDVKEVVLELGAYMVKLAGKGNDIEANKVQLLENIQNGKGYQKFIQLVENQGGDSSYIKDTSRFEKAQYIEKVYTNQTGYIKRMDAKEIGKIVCDLGAGRIRKEDSIDNAVGIVLHKKVSNKVDKQDALATIYANSKEKLEEAKKRLLEIIQIDENVVSKPKMILEIMQ